MYHKQHLSTYRAKFYFAKGLAICKSMAGAGISSGVEKM